MDSKEDVKARKRFGEAVRRRRAELGLTLAELGLAAKLSERTVGEIERGRALNVRDVTQFALESALGWAAGSTERILVDGKEPLLSAAGPTASKSDASTEDDLFYIYRQAQHADAATIKRMRAILEASQVDGIAERERRRQQ